MAYLTDFTPASLDRYDMRGVPRAWRSIPRDQREPSVERADLRYRTPREIYHRRAGALSQRCRFRGDIPQTSTPNGRARGTGIVLRKSGGRSERAGLSDRANSAETGVKLIAIGYN